MGNEQMMNKYLNVKSLLKQQFQQRRGSGGSRGSKLCWRQSTTREIERNMALKMAMSVSSALHQTEISQHLMF